MKDQTTLVTWAATISVAIMQADNGIVVAVRTVNGGMGPIQANHCRNQVDHFHRLVAHYVQQILAPPQPATAPTADIGSQLEKLTQLHAAGHLSDQEYSNAKSRLLG